MKGSYKYGDRTLRLSVKGLNEIGAPGDTYQRRALCLLASCGSTFRYDQGFRVLLRQLSAAPKSLGCRSRGYEDEPEHDAVKWINGLIYSGKLEVIA